MRSLLSFFRLSLLSFVVFVRCCGAAKSGLREFFHEVQDEVEPGSTQLERLPLGDINILAVTDVHSWVAGHGRHEPIMNAHYGHVLSFYERLKDIIAHNDKKGDLFFVMNGDFVDGTGLSLGLTPPSHLLPIEEKMPFDAVNLGNHELYKNETVQVLLDSGFIASWGGNYLTSNSLLAETRQPIGNRYTILHGSQTNTTLLTFGFLFDMQNHCGMTDVENPKDTIQSEWFTTALQEEQYDAILVLAHMDCIDPLVFDILHAIRQVVGSTVPVQFITGHTHRRCFHQLDRNAASMEAGRFLDTVGFASFNLVNEEGRTMNQTSTFHHAFMDANVRTLKETLGEDVQELMTPAGRNLTKLINETRQSLGLDHQMGCSPTTFQLARGLDQYDSLWRLYIEDVIPYSFIPGDFHPHLFIQSTGALRYDLFQGELVLDDVIAVEPFNNSIYRVCEKVSGADVQDVLRILNPGEMDKNRPNFAVSGGPVDEKFSYDIYSSQFDSFRLLSLIQKVSNQSCTPVPWNRTTLELWAQYVAEEMTCAYEYHTQIESHWLELLCLLLGCCFVWCCFLGLREPTGKEYSALLPYNTRQPATYGTAT